MDAALSSANRTLARALCFKNFSQHFDTHFSSSCSSVFLRNDCTHVEKHRSTKLLYIRSESRVCMASIIDVIFALSSSLNPSSIDGSMTVVRRSTCSHPHARPCPRARALWTTDPRSPHPQPPRARRLDRDERSIDPRALARGYEGDAGG
ncbi:hypothetical protein BE221DRAFT_75929 [Ostreococcus tauri]|uniref:Uncharacterized protein n=1 Tax=Ostreococcus tauri TaxID=70448 RepID=A0A1Y5ICQ5_OSTTA|nr:hypothetical protein BE221DRAFT_75929 [Ostreococcus tauri]